MDSLALASELLAIELYRMACNESHMTAAWHRLDPEDRAIFRDFVTEATTAEDIYRAMGSNIGAA